MQLYKQFVRPVLEYGAIALLSAPKTTLEKIQLVQNKAIKIAYRLPYVVYQRTQNTWASLKSNPLKSIQIISELIYTFIRRRLRIIQTPKGIISCDKEEVQNKFS